MGRYDQELERIRDEGLYRSLPWIQSGQGPHVTIDGTSYVQLCANNYLGLAEHQDLQTAVIRAVKEFGVGSGASRLLTGSMPPHQELEERLAKFKGTEASLIFNTGYMANLSLLSCLIPDQGIIFLDRLCHASLMDGARSSGREFRTFPHKNLKYLESLLDKKPRNKPSLIVTDGVFSMDGDIAPLDQLVPLARAYGAKILVDDAHATGVLGRMGRGSLEHFNLDNSNDDIIQMGTLGKAIGAFGAYVVGSQDLLQFLINKARGFTYTTALPPAICSAAVAGIDLIESEPSRRERLWENRQHLFHGLRQLEFDMLGSETPILPILTGDIETALSLSRNLFSNGILALPIRPPTVPRKKCRVRLSVMATHTREDLNHVLEVLTRYQNSIPKNSV